MIVSDLRVALSNSALGLSWDDITQHPTTLDSAVSLLQLESVQPFPNKPSEVTVSGRVIYWSENIESCEEYILKVADFLTAYLLGQCVPGVSRIQLSPFQIAYSGQVEDSDLVQLESYTITLTFSLVATVSP